MNEIFSSYAAERERERARDRDKTALATESMSLFYPPPLSYAAHKNSFEVIFMALLEHG